MSKVVLYGVDLSPPVRACLLTLEALEIPYEYKIVDLMAGEHRSEEFLKHNPQHTVPVLDDNGVWLWDSHAICAYLVSKYGKTDALYPKDLVKRAVVDQRMYFEASVLFMALRNICSPMFQKNITVVPKEKTESIVDGYDFVEAFLADNLYIAGNELTIADFCCVATISSLRGIVELAPSKYPKILSWLERLSRLPYYAAANGKGANDIINAFRAMLTEINVN